MRGTRARISRLRRAGRRTVGLTALVAVGVAVASTGPVQAEPIPGATTLRARAVLPAQTFAGGPPTNGYPEQPVQGVSGLVPLDAAANTYLALSDNGFGAITNSEDYLLRAYELEVRANNRGDAFSSVEVLGFRQFRDPDDLVPFTIVNELTEDRLLTGADFDPESLQVAPDGSLYVGEEFGPFVLHFSADGVLLEAPIALPDFDADPTGAGLQIRAPQNPGLEEGTVLRLANALRAHAQANGSELTPVISTDANLLRDANPATNVGSRLNPPPGSGLEPASSEIVDVAQLQAADFSVVPYTVNARARMDELLALGVDGLISDSPEVLYDAVAAFDADGDGTPGDYLLPDGRIDPEQFDAQGHRGARNLRPENTLPAFEAGLDELVNTLETDAGVTSDGVAILSHDPFYQAEKCRRADGAAYEEVDELLIRD
nr:esterase-like activity of phytase family protein [Acidimicrobiia bacterium]